MGATLFMPVSQSQTHEPGDRVAKALARFPAYTPPKSLFRFSDGGGIGSLRYGTLKISPPRDFNDPFELLPGITTKNLTAEDIIRSLTAPRGLFLQMQKSRGKAPADLREYYARIEAAVRSSPEKWPLHLSSMRDALAHTFREQMAVCCFSAFTTADLTGDLGIRHWSIYADHHHGFAIEYDGTHEYFKNVANRNFCFRSSTL